MYLNFYQIILSENPLFLKSFKLKKKFFAKNANLSCEIIFVKKFNPKSNQKTYTCTCKHM